MINKETKRAALILLGTGLACIALSFMSGCAADLVSARGPKGLPGPTGASGISVVQQVLPAGTLCSSGSGNLLTFAQDNAGTGQFVQGDTVLNSVLVCDGQTGQQGVQGVTGATGASGSNGTVLTPIQFCPSSFVPTYPSRFVESGLCIGGNLYGVYSANSGFWAELPPGRYSSDGINASCSFNIKANCVVEN